MILAVLCLPVQTVCTITTPAGTIFLFDIFIGLSALAMLLLLPHQADRRQRGRISGFILTLILFLLVMALSANFSHDKNFSAIRLLRVCHVILIALVALFFINDSGHMETIIGVWLLSAGVAIVMGFAGVMLFYIGFKTSDENMFIRGYGSLPLGNYPRVASLFSGFNKFCGYLTVTAPLVWYSWLGNPQRKRYVVLLIGLFVVAAFTVSPGLGGVFLTFGFLVAWLPARDSFALAKPNVQKWAFWLGIAAASIFLLAATLSPVDLLNSQIAGSPRLKTWAAAIHTIYDHPILGLGLGLTGVDVEYHSANGVTQYLSSAHNTWLSIGAQSGICGIVALLVIVVSLFSRRLVAHDTHKPSSEIGSTKPHTAGVTCENQSRQAAINLTLKIAIAGSFLYHGLVQSTEWFRYQWVVLGMLAASNSLLYSKQESKGYLRIGRWVQKVFERKSLIAEKQ